MQLLGLFLQTSGFIVDKCPQDSVLGCLILTTMIPIGEVTCEGDGVDRTIRFPLQPFGMSLFELEWI